MPIPNAPQARSIDDIIAAECARDTEFARVWPEIWRQTANESERWRRKRARGPWRHHSQSHRK